MRRDPLDFQVAEFYDEVKKLRAANERLRAALQKYGLHLDGCRFFDGRGCDCGFDAALSEDSRP